MKAGYESYSFSVPVFLALPARTNKGESTRIMNNEAPTLLQNDKEKEAKELFAEIFAKYPETLIAAGDNQRFFQKEIFDKSLDEVLANKRLDLIKTALDAFRLDNERYPTATEGLDALLWNKSNEDNWQGPYLPMPCKSFLADFRYVEDQVRGYRLGKLQ